MITCDPKRKSIFLRVMCSHDQQNVAASVIPDQYMGNKFHLNVIPTKLRTSSAFHFESPSLSLPLSLPLSLSSSSSSSSLFY